MNEQRLHYVALSKEAFAGFVQVKQAVAASENIDHVMIALLELRVSLINGCSYCVHSHSEELKKLSMPD
ncbi:MAG: carboxymuconolactone decarboxylase family protein, partial [Wohlfahrtiimonas sp.]